jgi:hypothetical protein
MTACGSGDSDSGTIDSGTRPLAPDLARGLVLPQPDEDGMAPEPSIHDRCKAVFGQRLP